MDLMYQLTQVIAPKVTGGTRGLSGIPTLVSGAIPNYYLTFGLTFAFGILMGEQRPDAGRVFFRGEDVTRMPTRRRVARGIARTCQVPRPFGEMTVLDNIRAGMMPDSVRRLVAERPPEGIDWEIARNAGFGEREAVMYPGAALDGGAAQARARPNPRDGTGRPAARRGVRRSHPGRDRQMVSLGRALMSSPCLLVVDEPTIGLAPRVCHDIAAALRRMNEELGITVLITEQNVNFATRLARDVHVLETGEIRLRGSAEELMNNPHVREAYFGH